MRPVLPTRQQRSGALSACPRQCQEQQAKIYAAILVAWTQAGGAAAFAPAKPPKLPKAPPPPGPVRLTNRDAEIRSLRRQITTLEDRLQKARARLREIAPKTVAVPTEPRLTIRLPRQNYGDDT
jgi:hypothetical protein